LGAFVGNSHAHKLIRKAWASIERVFKNVKLTKLKEEGFSKVQKITLEHEYKVSGGELSENRSEFTPGIKADVFLDGNEKSGTSTNSTKLNG